MKAKLFRTFLVLTVLLVGVVPAALAHPDDQHGPLGGHLPGTGAVGNIEFVGKAIVTGTEGLVADVAISPDGQWAFLANWGEPDCAGPETGGQNSPDAGAWVVDISDLENPETVGFIPSHQDSRPGEGMQVVEITTRYFSGNILVMNNEQCGKNGKGGVSLWDVTDPRNPRKLSEHFGDRGGVARGDANDIHSAFAWDTGANAYVVMTDNFETADVDILDITKPNRPRLIAELNLDAMFPGILQTPLGLTQVFLHDMVVKKIGANWVMLLSYWDGGYVQLNVNNPAAPTLIGDTDYNNPDPELYQQYGTSELPEGNGHQNEFTKGNTYFIGTDEDFAPYGATDFAIASGPFAGPYPSVPVPGAAPIVILPDQLLNGPVVYGGYGCPASAAIPTPASIGGGSYLASLIPTEEKIIVLQRGPTGDPNATEGACFPGEKAHEAFLKGWDSVLFVQRHGPGGAPTVENPPFCGSGAFVDLIVGVCTNHEAFHKLFGRTVDFTFPYPAGDPGDLEPNIGEVGSKITVTAAFDGWGYVHLFSNTLVGGKFAELDTYAITEAMSPVFATGYGDLSVHEVATDPQDESFAYLSYYAGGLRSLRISTNSTECAAQSDTAPCLVEVGSYIDEDTDGAGPDLEGNNFWGVEAFVRGGCTYIAASDRDSGLWIFKNTDTCP